MASQQALGQQYFNRARRNLMQRVGLGNQNPYSTYRPNVMDPLGMSAPGLRQPGGLNLTHGVSPSDADVYRYMNMRGGQRVVNGAEAGRQVSRMTAEDAGGPSAEPELTPEQQYLMQFAQSLQSERDKANAANLKRYNEVHGLQTALGQRNQERVGNWGEAQRQLNEESAKATLGNMTANLASRGLSNSTILPAFQQRNARDLALQQQQLSEMRDSRLAEYDTRDTNNLAGLIERREDVAPSLDSLMQLAMEFGRSGDGERMEQVQNQIEQLRAQIGRGGQGYQPMYNIPQYGPRGRPPVFLGPEAMGVPNWMLPGIPQPQNIRSNRYPTPRGQRQIERDGGGEHKGPPTRTFPEVPPLFRGHTFDVQSGTHTYSGQTFNEDQWQRAMENRRRIGMAPL
jgi:hypothetical protein